MTEKEDIVKGLSSGADDYLTKPFDRGELLARIGVGRRIIVLHREIDAKNKLLKEMALTDSLTGLPNRRAIEDWANRQLRGAARHGYPLWIVYADLDCFKSINDNHGHDAGDQVLKEFAATLNQCTRASDMSGRIGGDEFILVLTHVEDGKIQLVVERLRERFVSKKFSFGGESMAVTASFGVCGFQGKEPPEFSMLVRQADKALYCAKRAGRNQIKIEPFSVLIP
jgi:two-component system, cell cycle response regulator